MLFHHVNFSLRVIDHTTTAMYVGDFPF